jgi:uncharacterized Zn-finger protein
MTDESAEKHQVEFRRLETLLSPVSAFLRKHESLTYLEFDHATVHDLTLFTVEPDYDFPAVREVSDRISQSLPAVKRIFAKPIINLIDADDVLPVETVRIINQDTMHHLAGHSQNVADITARGVKPRKLLTRIYEDNYGLYENLVFCNYVDETLRFVRQSLSPLRDLVYTNDILELNLLERVNHMNYFLTLGKLQTGYLRDFARYYGTAKTLYTELSAIANALQSRLYRPVYAKNKARNLKLSLKKTNIFLMQKDYHQVYKTYRYLLEKKKNQQEKVLPVDLAKLGQDYFSFVEALTLFAVGEFSFEMNPSEKISFSDLDAIFRFRKWELRVKSIENRGILISLIKDRIYRILLIPTIDPDLHEDKEGLGMKYGADESIVCTPFEEDYLTRKTSFISAENIDSFRRIQQMVLRAMIESDDGKKDCPFCDGDLVYDPKTDEYRCDTCRTVIRKGRCLETGEDYDYTLIAAQKKTGISPLSFAHGDEWLYQRKVESMMYFRNITPITPEGEIVCPHCGKVHIHKI